MKIVWSEKAYDRIGEIYLYIAQDNAAAAERWVSTIVKRVERLLQFPESGRKVPELDKKEFREVIVGNYRIIYRLRLRTINVLTVRHFKQVLPLDDIGDS